MEFKTNILSVELLVFVAIMAILLRLRKTKILSVSIVQGMICYVPPKDEDFEMLEKTNQKPKTNMKGEVKKRDKKFAEQPARFPMRTLEISEGDFLRYN